MKRELKGLVAGARSRLQRPRESHEERIESLPHSVAHQALPVGESHEERIERARLRTAVRMVRIWKRLLWALYLNMCRKM